MSSEEKSKYRLYILGKNIFEVPCFKETMLYSVSSYFGVGLLTFLFTSRPTFSSHCGFASFIIVTFGYFTPCRLKYKNDRILMNEYEKAMGSNSDTEDNNSNKQERSVLEDA